jgi:hypothetical protein
MLDVDIPLNAGCLAPLEGRFDWTVVLLHADQDVPIL